MTAATVLPSAAARPAPWIQDLQFSRYAPIPMAILDAFQASGWLRRIGNPFATDLDGDAGERLHDAIKRLNARMPSAAIRFHRDGTGQGVCWQRRG